jgi:hypothetical protein
MIDEVAPRTQRAKVAVERARKTVSDNSVMIDSFLDELPEFKDRHEPHSVAIEDFRFDLEAGDEVIHQKIRTTNKFVTFFRDMLSQ